MKRKIRFVWNLGGDTASITHPMELHKKDLNYDEAWYQIEANRTMNVGNLIGKVNSSTNKEKLTQCIKQNVTFPLNHS